MATQTFSTQGFYVGKGLDSVNYTNVLTPTYLPGTMTLITNKGRDL